MEIDATVLKEYIDTKTAALDAKIDSVLAAVQANGVLADDLQVRLVFAEDSGSEQSNG